MYIRSDAAKGYIATTSELRTSTNFVLNAMARIRTLGSTGNGGMSKNPAESTPTEYNIFPVLYTCTCKLIKQRGEGKPG